MTKNVTHCSEQIFGGDLPKRIQGIKNNKKLFKKEKKNYLNQKHFKRFPQSPGNHYQKGYQQDQSSNYPAITQFRQKEKLLKKHN